MAVTSESGTDEVRYCDVEGERHTQSSGDFPDGFAVASSVRVGMLRRAPKLPRPEVLKVNGFLILSLFLLPADDKSVDVRETQERRQLQGIWKVVACQCEGKAVAISQSPYQQFVFADDRIILSKPDVRSDGTCGVDLSRTPHAFEFWIQRTEIQLGWRDLWRKAVVFGPGERWRGAYQLNGDTLTICTMRESGGIEPPADFCSRRSDDRILITLKREKR
jgi:uncharacterized protein (TIGR03067 family)